MKIPDGGQAVDSFLGDNGQPPDTGDDVDSGVEDTGDLPDNGGNDADTSVPDVGPPDDEIAVAGRVRRLGAYLAGANEYVGSSAVVARGVSPEVSTISEDADVGFYSLVLPANGDVVFFTFAEGHHPTFLKVTFADQDAQNLILPIAEEAWVAEIATAHGIEFRTPFACQTAQLAGSTCAYAVVVGRITDDGAAGQGQIRPVAGVSRDAFVVRGPNDSAWSYSGPHFLQADGTSSLSTESIDGLYLLFVEVPQQDPLYPYVNLRIRIEHDDAGTLRRFGPVDVQAFRGTGGSVNWANIPETGIGEAPPLTGVDFDTQVYPLLLPVPWGGLGCQGCHSGPEPAGGVNLLGADAAYDALQQRVNVAQPDASLVLSKPLYEVSGTQDHPIFAFGSDGEVGYRTIRTWIAEGAMRSSFLLPVSFSGEIHPGLHNEPENGGWGCRSCHFDSVTATSAPGGFYLAADPDAVYEEIVNEGSRIETDPELAERSLLLTNPLTGNQEPHLVKRISDNTDPRWMLIYRWIREGYVNDTP